MFNEMTFFGDSFKFETVFKDIFGLSLKALREEGFGNVAKPRIVIIGGGFAGVFAAKELRAKMGDDAEIELINKDNYFVFQPLLPEVAGGGINSSDAITSLRLLLKKVQVRLAEVTDIDFDKKIITVL